MKRSTTHAIKATLIGSIILAAAACGEGEPGSPFGAPTGTPTSSGGTFGSPVGSSTPGAPTTPSSAATSPNSAAASPNSAATSQPSGQPGTFGAGCQQNDQCQSGLCVGLENRPAYCSQQCNGSCPTGYTCVQATEQIAVCASNADVAAATGQQDGSQATPPTSGSTPQGATSCSANEVNGWTGCANQCAEMDEACYGQCTSQYLGQSCVGCLQALSQCAQASSCDPFASQACCASQRTQCVGQ